MEPLTGKTPRTDDLEAAVRFQERLTEFMARVMAKTGLKLTRKTGTSYVKILTTRPDGVTPKAYCYVDLDTGGVLRANGMTGPVYRGSGGQARGNIFDEDYGVSNMDEKGPLELPNGKPKGYKHDRYIPRPKGRKAWLREQEEMEQADKKKVPLVKVG